jgi:RimJ/RimL family protein N-acetyltransferase
VKIENTNDWDLVRKIVTHEKVYDHISDDFSPAAHDWQPFKSEGIYYLLVTEDHPLGLFALFQHNGICWTVHTCLLPEAYGEKAKEAGKEGQRWMWENTPCQRIITEVPSYNRLALKFAKDCGMTEYGVNPKSYMKHGKLRDVVLLGVNKCL